MNKCARCDAGMDTDTAVICFGCTRLLNARLVTITQLVFELEITTYRMGKMSEPHTPIRNPEMDPVKMPFHIGASKVKEDTRATLASWAKLVADARGIQIGCHDDARSIARWLLQWVSWIRRHEAAGDMVDEVGACIRRMYRAIDLTPERTLVGNCPECDTPLWCYEDDWTVECRTCGTEHEAFDVQVASLRRARDELHTAAQLSRMFKVGGEFLSPDRIRKWRDRGHIEAVACDVRTRRELYRPGDVAEALVRASKNDNRRKA